MKNVLLVVALIFLCLPAAPVSASQQRYTLEEERILAYIKPSPVIAVVLPGAVIYNSYDKTSGRVGHFSERENVEILQDRTALWYRVISLDSGKDGWVLAEDLVIPPDEPVNESRLTDEQLNEYAALVNPKSKTAYFTITDIGRQLIYVFKGGQNNWKFERSMLCTTGVNASPTTRGSFTISARGEWFYSERLSGGAKYWVRFNGSYLFHSVAMDKEQNVIDEVLGVKRSSGCVRLSLEDAEWFYNNIPDGSLVIII